MQTEDLERIYQELPVIAGALKIERDFIRDELADLGTKITDLAGKLDAAYVKELRYIEAALTEILETESFKAVLEYFKEHRTTCEKLNGIHQ